MWDCCAPETFIIIPRFVQPLATPSTPLWQSNTLHGRKTRTQWNSKGKRHQYQFCELWHGVVIITNFSLLAMQHLEANHCGLLQHVKIKVKDASSHNFVWCNWCRHRSQQRLP